MLNPGAFMRFKDVETPCPRPRSAYVGSWNTSRLCLLPSPRSISPLYPKPPEQPQGRPPPLGRAQSLLTNAPPDLVLGSTHGSKLALLLPPPSYSLRHGAP